MTSQVFETKRLKPRNNLNHLQGKRWIKFTKSWFVLNPAPRKNKVLHPASFPESLAAKFIEFFTKKDQWILDPFSGSGSTQVAARSLERNSIGIELYAEYVTLARQRLEEISDSKSKAILIQADSRHLKDVFIENGLPKMDFCFSSPPYWNQLKRNSERQRKRLKKGMKTAYGNDQKDLALIDDYNYFLHQLEIVFDNVYEVMVEGAYLVVVTNNIYAQGRLWPLAFDTFSLLSKKWTPKDEKIWCQDNKKLFPFGMFHSYVGNRSHHYCLIFRKDFNLTE